MAQLWVKICANTTLEDALAAIDAGADAVGFVFAPSKRQVTPSQVAHITASLPPHVERIGVFCGTDAPAIAAAARRAGLTAVQLHGGLQLALAAQIQALEPGLRLLHTAHWSVEAGTDSGPRVRSQLQLLAGQPADQPQRILIDAKSGSTSGGLGLAYDWSHAAPVFGAEPSLQVVAAGGLTPENVAEAVHVLSPWGVDVASGVEASPGRKDLGRLRAFVHNARSAHS